jgi:hypothetical protein
VNLGDGEPLDINADEVVRNETRASQEESEDSDFQKLHDVYNVREMTGESSVPPELKPAIMRKL